MSDRENYRHTNLEEIPEYYTFTEDEFSAGSMLVSAHLSVISCGCT